MTRRSVSLPPELERAVRQLQARLLTTTDRDISFNDALNIALAASFSAADLPDSVDAGEWSRLLKGSDWESGGDLSEIGKVALDIITPTAFGATSTPAHARSQRQPARRASPRPAPRMPRRVARARPSVDVTPATTDDEAVEQIVFEPIDGTPPPPVEAPVDPYAPEAAADEISQLSETEDDSSATDPIVNNAAAWGATESEEIGGDRASTGSTADSLEFPSEDPEPDDVGTEEEPTASSIPLPSSWDDPIVAEVVDLPVDFDPAPRSIVDESTIPADELEPVEPEPDNDDPAADTAPEPPSRWGGAGGMDLDALRQAIVGGDPEMSEESVARPPFQPASPADDIQDFASRMSGFAADSSSIETDSVIVPEAPIPSVEELLDDGDSDGEVEPRANDESEAPEEVPGAEQAEEEPTETPDDDEEPTDPPPADQADGYSELDRALKEAAAAYEERLRNSGAT